MNDLRFAWRQLVKNPGFTATAVLTLGLGIGVNTSMFSALQATLSRSLPYPDAGRLVQVFRSSVHSQRGPFAAPNFLLCQIQNRDFERMAALDTAPFNLAEPGQPAERVRGVKASASLFPLLGIQPALGRQFTDDEDQPGRNNVVILDHRFWLRRFAGDTNIIGRSIRLDGESVTVVGVMPERFHDTMLLGPIDLWRPIVFTADESQNYIEYLKVVARIKPGVSFAQAQAGMDLVAARLARDRPDNNLGAGLRLVPLAQSSMPPEGRRVIWLTMLLAIFVLLIACANLANLQFARTALRTRELAIRGALGAPRGRLLRQLITESLFIAFLGGLLGLLLANWENELLSRLIVFDGERMLALTVDHGVLAFALAVTTASGLAFGLVPAWLASRTGVNDTLKKGARGATGDRSQHRLQQSLIVAEVALALVLLAGAGLVVRGLQRFTLRDPGWRVDGLSTGNLSLPESKYGADTSKSAFALRLQEKLAALPGAERAAVAYSLPFSQFNITASFAIDGRPDWPQGREPLRFINGISPGYFETLGIPLLAGRDFTPADNSDHPQVLIINEAMARAFWPSQSPLGQRIYNQEIVGVVGNVRFPANPGAPATRFQTYRPFAQEPRSHLAVAVRGSVTASTLRRAVAQLDPDQPVGEAGLARAAVGRILDMYAAVGRLLGGFALLGLLLASLGIYGVIARFVAQRTSELGLRMALGAQVSDVSWLVIGKGLRMTLLGAAIGLLGAFGFTRLLASAMPDLVASDPAGLACVVALLVTVAMLACWLPARRAARLDPMAALRCE